MIDDIDVYLADHGRPCSAGGHDFLALKDQADSEVAVGRMGTISAAHMLTAATSDVAAAGLKNGVPVMVDGVRHTVRELLQLDDGAFTQVNVSKA
jgi:hypothetical protein